MEKTMTEKERIKELEYLLKLSLQYLEHPDVLEITNRMVCAGSVVVEKIEKALI